MKWFLGLLLLLTGCASIQPPPPPYLTLAAGKQWVLRDTRTGKLTTFTIGDPELVGSLETPSFPLRITKQDAESYWNPGAEHSIDFYLHEDADGTIWSPLSIVYSGDTPGAVQSRIAMRGARAGEPRVDYLLGPLAEPGQTVVTHYLYTADGITWPEGLWKTSYTLENVNAPAYRGEALCARYSEGSETRENNAEQWCFARGVGLVRLTFLFDGARQYSGENSHVLELVSLR